MLVPGNFGVLTTLVLRRLVHATGRFSASESAGRQGRKTNFRKCLVVEPSDSCQNLEFVTSILKINNGMGQILKTTDSLNSVNSRNTWTRGDSNGGRQQFFRCTKIIGALFADLSNAHVRYFDRVSTFLYEVSLLCSDKIDVMLGDNES